MTAGTGSEGPELVVTVVKNVVTIHDMGTDDESARQVKGGKWGAEDAMVVVRKQESAVGAPCAYRITN
jgi:hypothetical protein